MKHFLVGLAIIILSLAAGFLLDNRYIMLVGVISGGAVQLLGFYFAWVDMKMLDLKHQGVLEFYKKRRNKD